MFIGREKELKLLNTKINSSKFEFGIVYGRRLISKTRLLQEVVKKHDAIYYVANEMGLEYNLSQLSAAVAGYFDNLFLLIHLSYYLNILHRKAKTRR